MQFWCISLSEKDLLKWGSWVLCMRIQQLKISYACIFWCVLYSFKCCPILHPVTIGNPSKCRNFPMRLMLAVILFTLSLFVGWQWRFCDISFSLSWPAPNLMCIHIAYFAINKYKKLTLFYFNILKILIFLPSPLTLILY